MDTKLTILAKLLMAHADEQEKQDLIQVIRNLPAEPKKPKKSSGPKAPVAHKQTGERIYGLTLPEKGSLDAQGFIQACHNAGKRPFKAMSMAGTEMTVIKVDPSKTREDMIKAIAAYTGYDARGSFGTQEQAARAKAAIEIGYRKTNGQTRGEARANVQKSLDRGTTKVSPDHGMADQHAKRLANLQAQETQLAEASIDCEKMINDTSLPLEDREQALAMMELAEERLAHVRKDLVAAANGAKWVHPHLGK